MIDQKVSYIHSIVKDYLRLEVVRARLQQTTTGTIFFDLNLSLIQSFIVNLKRGVYSCHFESAQTHDKIVWMTVIDAFMLAGRMYPGSNQNCSALLHELSVMAYHWFRRSRQIWPSLTPSAKELSSSVPARWWRHFAVLAVRLGLESYIQKQQEDHKPSTSSFDIHILLECALRLLVDFFPRRQDVRKMQQDIPKSLSIYVFLFSRVLKWSTYAPTNIIPSR